MFNQDMAKKLKIDAAEQLAAAKERQPGMGDVDLTEEDDVRIGDEYNITISEPAAQQSAPSQASASQGSSALGTLGSMAAGAALLASGAGIASVPALLTSDPVPAVAPVTPGPDRDTVSDVDIRGGVEGAES